VFTTFSLERDAQTLPAVFLVAGDATPLKKNVTHPLHHPLSHARENRYGGSYSSPSNQMVAFHSVAAVAVA
jgi:hypothetical protein